MNKDCPGQYTFMGAQGCSAIDLFWANSSALGLIEDLEVMKIASQSDHLPIAVSLIVDVESESDQGVLNGNKTSRMYIVIPWRIRSIQTG